MNDVGNNRNRVIDALRKQANMSMSREQFLDNFTIGEPLRAQGVLPRRNTSIKVNSKIDSKYFGVKTAWYDRIHVSELGDVVVTRTTETKTSQLLNQINEKYNLDLTEYDIIDYDLIPSQIGTFSLVLPINPSSLMFYDGEFIPTQDKQIYPPIIAYPADTLIRSYCNGFDRYGVFVDAAGMESELLLQTECVECGFDPATNIYLVIDGGSADQVFNDPWQWAGEIGAA